MTVGERIALRRKELQLSQTDLAKRAGYKSKSDISKMENAGDDIGMNRISRIAKALNVTTAYLLGWEEAIKVDYDVPIETVQGAQKAVMEMLNDDSRAQRMLAYFKMYENAPEQIRETIDMLLKSSQQLPESQERTHNTE